MAPGRQLAGRRRVALGQRDVPVAMAPLESGALSRLLETLDRVLAHGLQQPVAALAGSLLDVHQRLVDQPAEHGDGLAAPQRILGADVLGRLQPEAAGEHREPAQQHLLAGLEQLEAPGERRPQRLLAGHRRAGSGREQVERVVEALDDLSRGEDAHPRRRQLDRQRHPVEAVAEGGDRVRVVAAELESGRGLRGAGGEQPHRLRLQRLLRGRPGDQPGEGERGDAPGHLAGNAERLAAGRQHGQVRAVAEQRLD